MDILACPACKVALELSVEAEGDGEVISGALKCSRCNTVYIISEGIPRLLPQVQL